jgi:hypothetical protein
MAPPPRRPSGVRAADRSSTSTSRVSLHRVSEQSLTLSFLSLLDLARLSGCA